MIDLERTDRVLKLALAAAGEKGRALTRTYLIKCVYLADLAYAEEHRGETFTGTPWRFHYFGPWAADVQDRIEAVVEATKAERRSFVTSDQEREAYLLQDARLRDDLERQLPPDIVSDVGWVVEDFPDLRSLLRHVYLTRPMVRAAPGEFLDFAPVSADVGEAQAATIAESNPWLSPKAMREREKARKTLRAEVKRRLEAARSKIKPAVFPAPRYDETFFEGMRWLDELAGEPLEPLSGEVEFSEEIWKSPARSGEEVP